MTRMRIMLWKVWGQTQKSADAAAMDMDMEDDRKVDEVTPEPKTTLRNVEDNLDEIHALLSQNPKLAALSAAAAANANADVDDDEILPKETKGRSARGRGSRRGRGASTSRRTSTATPARPPRQSTVKFGARAAPSSMVICDDDNDDDDIQDESDRQAEEAASASAVARRPRASTRPTRRAAKVAPLTIEISDGEDSEETPAPRRKRKASTPAAGSSSRARSRAKRESPAPSGSARVGGPLLAIGHAVAGRRRRLILMKRAAMTLCRRDFDCGIQALWAEDGVDVLVDVIKLLVQGDNIRTCLFFRRAFLCASRQVPSTNSENYGSAKKS